MTNWICWLDWQRRYQRMVSVLHFNWPFFSAGCPAHRVEYLLLAAADGSMSTHSILILILLLFYFYFFIFFIYVVSVYFCTGLGIRAHFVMYPTVTFLLCFVLFHFSGDFSYIWPRSVWLGYFVIIILVVVLHRISHRTYCSASRSLENAGKSMGSNRYCD